MKIKRFTESNQFNYEVESFITTISLSDDWSGIYLGNELLSEGHSLRLDEILKSLIRRRINLADYSYKHLTLHKDNDYVDWLDEDICPSSCPETLTEYINLCTDNNYDVRFE